MKPPTAITNSRFPMVSTTQFRSLIEEWLRSHDVSEASRVAYRRNIRNFQRWSKVNCSQTPTRETILAYKKYLITQKYTACTQSNYLSAVREFFKFMERVHGLPNPTRDLKGVRQPSGHRKDALSLDQLRALFLSVPTDSLMGLRDSLILQIAGRLALRSCEMSRADIGDVQRRGDKHILLVRGKGKLEKDNWVVIGDDCYAHIQRYLLSRGTTKATDPLFISLSDNCYGSRLGTTSLRKITKFYLRKIGLNSPRITLHSLRHTAISLSLQAGASLLECKEMARHEVITTTMVYAHSAHRLLTSAELKLEKLLQSEIEEKKE